MDTIETFTVVGGKPTIKKDPGATLDYGLNLTKWLARIGPTSRVATVTAVPGEGGITLAVGAGYPADAETYDDGRRVRAWLSGGTPGQVASVTFRFTTDDTPPRIDERTLFFRIDDR